jgi:hypothetical protein
MTMVMKPEQQPLQWKLETRAIILESLCHNALPQTKHYQSFFFFEKEAGVLPFIAKLLF